jgi:hypothetical protein
MNKVTNGVEPLLANPTDAQRSSYKEVKKKDNKTLFFIHQCVDAKCLRKMLNQQIQRMPGMQELRRQYEVM